MTYLLTSLWNTTCISKTEAIRQVTFYMIACVNGSVPGAKMLAIKTNSRKYIEKK